jgi:hypothetical protein
MKYIPVLKVRTKQCVFSVHRYNAVFVILNEVYIYQQLKSILYSGIHFINPEYTNHLSYAHLKLYYLFSLFRLTYTGILFSTSYPLYIT